MHFILAGVTKEILSLNKMQRFIRQRALVKGTHRPSYKPGAGDGHSLGSRSCWEIGADGVGKVAWAIIGGLNCSNQLFGSY